jgi:hypothetical protein
VKTIATYKCHIIDYEKVELDVQYFINLPKYNEFLESYKSEKQIPEKLFESMYKNFNEDTSRKIMDQIKNISKKDILKILSVKL